MAKHTPGPWRAEKPDMFGDCNILHDGDSLTIGAIVSNMRPPAEVYANALLAASAPELQQALKTALDHIEHMAAFIGSQNAGYSFESLGEDMPGMRAALKSSGTTPSLDKERGE